MASFLRAGGFNEGAINYSKRYVKGVGELVQNLRLDKVDSIKSHLQSNPDFDHSVATVMVAALLSIPLALSSARSVNIVGLSALLHDVGFTKMDPKFRNCDLEKLSVDEIREYNRHPLIGAEIVREIKGIEPVVAQAVAQHHERRTGKGFPNQLGANGINLIAEIVGLSEELVKQMEVVAKDPSINLRRAMERNFSNEFSVSVFNALKLYIR